MKDNPKFFDFAAEVGLTKHIGGVEATEEIARLCHIDESKYVLDVGCGAGVTACYLARKYRCHVAGVDIVEKMIERSEERSRRAGISDQVEFKIGDAQDLPFENDVFDVVITESVTAFPENKQKAVNEYKRVTKPGGYIGLNETTWLKFPPPQEIIDWASQDVGASVKPLTSHEWKELLVVAGLEDIVEKSYTVNVKKESRGIVERYGFWGMLTVLRKMLSLYMKNPDYRKFVKGVQKSGVAPKNLNEYFGYGLYIGRK
jgi:arsenite methyltransferase